MNIPMTKKDKPVMTSGKFLDVMRFIAPYTCGLDYHDNDLCQSFSLEDMFEVSNWKESRLWDNQIIIEPTRGMNKEHYKVIEKLVQYLTKKGVKVYVKDEW